jgi:hypothetical protein
MPSPVQPVPKAQFQRSVQSESRHHLKLERAKLERVGQSRGHRPRMWACLSVLLSALALASVARADTLMLANGDRLTGKIVKSDGKELTFETDYTGTATMRSITVEWAAVRQITSTAPLYVVTSQGTTVGGTATTEGTDLVITPATGAAQRIPFANVAALRSQSEQTTYEGTLHPGLLNGWETNGALGFGLARGNSKTTNLTVGFNATRATLHDKLVAYMNSIYASSGTVVAPGVTAGVTANDIRGGALYQHDLRARAFVYGSADFEYNELQFLNLRSIWGLGAGYHAIKRMETTLDLLGGGNYTRESYSTGVQRNIAGLTFGDILQHKFGENSTLNQTFYFYPELSNPGEYRIAFDMGFVTKIKKWLGWQSTISDRYISDPIPGTVSNDLIFSTGFSFAWSH